MALKIIERKSNNGFYWDTKHPTLSGSHERLLRSVPIGSKPVFLKMKIHRVKCKECHCIRQENVHFLTGKRSYTNRFSRLVVELSRIGTIQDVARFLHLSWDTVKDIQKRYLQRHYGNPDSTSRRVESETF